MELVINKINYLFESIITEYNLIHYYGFLVTKRHLLI